MASYLLTRVPQRMENQTNNLGECGYHLAVDGAVPESLVIRLDRKKHTIRYQPGDTVLEAARRGGLRPPFSCEAGNCATCMAHLDTGSVTMRANNALSDEDLDEGWVLTCQSIPTSAEIVVNYDA
jgi:3-ketosteroid 9alpha-monooxygenase subunit B